MVNRGDGLVRTVLAWASGGVVFVLLTGASAAEGEGRWVQAQLQEGESSTGISTGQRSLDILLRGRLPDQMAASAPAAGSASAAGRAVPGAATASPAAAASAASGAAAQEQSLRDALLRAAADDLAAKSSLRRGADAVVLPDIPKPKPKPTDTDQSIGGDGDANEPVAPPKVIRFLRENRYWILGVSMALIGAAFGLRLARGSRLPRMDDAADHRHVPTSRHGSAHRPTRRSR